MIPWLVLAFLASSSQASRPRGIRAEVNYHQLLLLSSVIMDELEQLLILWVWILENIFFRTFWDFVCRLLHCTTLARISDVLTAATRSPSSKSMTTTVIVRWGTQHFLLLSLNRCYVHSISAMVRMGQTSQAPQPAPMASSSVRMRDTRPWSFPLAGWASLCSAL